MSTAPFSMNNDMDENAADLQFGGLPADVKPMTFAEVMLVLSAHKDRFEAANMPVSDRLVHTLDHVKRFTQFRTKESSASAREVFKDSMLHEFEIAQIINLCPESAEEAFELIPSLRGRISEETLEKYIVTMQSYKL